MLFLLYAPGRTAPGLAVREERLVLYDRLTPQQAADAFKKEVEGMLASAR